MKNDPTVTEMAAWVAGNESLIDDRFRPMAVSIAKWITQGKSGTAKQVRALRNIYLRTWRNYLPSGYDSGDPPYSYEDASVLVASRYHYNS